MMTNIESTRSSADLDSVGMSFGFEPFAFCLPPKPMQYLEATQASCNLENESHMLSMKEREDRILDSQGHC